MFRTHFDLSDLNRKELARDLSPFWCTTANWITLSYGDFMLQAKALANNKQDAHQQFQQANGHQLVKH
uniref:Uncharacterized protein n=1 Tax=Ditylenchus dipsaci TaxID=166011 RepID=A0A915D9M9_9BILA